MTVNVYRDGAVHVRAEQCDQCLFTPDRLVPGRRAAELVRETTAQVGAPFVCHKAQVTDEAQSICRGWWDRFAHRDPITRLAIRTDVVRYVTSPARP
jgi:hypothetical protein